MAHAPGRRVLHLAALAVLVGLAPIPAAGATLHVSASLGDDARSGLEPSLPKKTIQSALAAAVAPSEIRVAEGTYVASKGAGTQLELVQGISLSGGWNDTFTARDPEARVTRIEDQTAGGAEAGAIYATAAGLDMTTVVEGFLVQAGNADSSAAVRVRTAAGPTLRGNVLLGGDGALGSPGSSAGLRIEGSPVVLGNRIAGGSAWSAFGVEVVSGAPLLGSNVIEGGFGVTSSTGVSVASGSADVLWNTIDGGSGGELVVGIRFASSTPRIEDNIVFTSAGITARICLAEGNTAAVASSIGHNDLFDCPTALYANARAAAGGSCPFDPGLDCATDLASVNDPTFTGAGSALNNVAANPSFLNRGAGDLHLTAATPVAIREEALDRTALVPLDRDGQVRSAPFSMGAYEYRPGQPGQPGAGGGGGERDVMACSHGGAGGAWALALAAIALGRLRRRAAPRALVVALALSLPATVAAAPRGEVARTVVLPLRAGVAIEPKLAEAVSDAFVVAVQTRLGKRVIAPRDLETVLGLERQRQLLGCTEDLACIAEIGGALGVERIVYGSIARLGESLTLSAQVIDVAAGSAIRRSLQRVRGGDDALLDAAERAAAELFPDSPGTAGTPPPTAPATSAPAADPARATFVSLGAAANTTSLGGDVLAGVGLRWNDRLSAEARLEATGGGWWGGGLRAAYELTRGRFRPVVAIDALWLRKDTSAYGVGLEVGVGMRLSRSLRASVGVPVLWLASQPDRTQVVYLLAGAGLALEL